jgi:hypothetical protein
MATGNEITTVGLCAAELNASPAVLSVQPVRRIAHFVSQYKRDVSTFRRRLFGIATPESRTGP